MTIPLWESENTNQEVVIPSRIEAGISSLLHLFISRVLNQQSYVSGTLLSAGGKTLAKIETRPSSSL